METSSTSFPSVVLDSRDGWRGGGDDLGEFVGRSSERLEAEACSLASSIAAVTCRWLLVVGELDRREAWRSWGCRGMSHWLSWKCGMALTTARHHLEVARRLVELPLIRRRFGAGTLSYSKVRALCRVATVETEAALIEMADAGTAAQLERMLRAYEAAVRAGAPSTAEEHRGLRFCGTHANGTITIRIDATPELYKALQARVAEYAASVPKECVAGAVDPSAARAHDALERLVSGPDPAQLVINLHAELADVEAFIEADPAETRHECGPAEPCELAGVTAAGQPAGPVCWARDRGELPGAIAAGLLGSRRVSPAMAEMLRRIGCDARVRLVLDDGGRSLDLGRTSRDPSRPLRRYILGRDHHRCRFAGCDRRGEQIHHIWPWIEGGPTDRANLVALCRYHHRLMHPGGWWISGDPQRPDGLEFHAPFDERRFGERIPVLAGASVETVGLVQDPSGVGVEARNPAPMDLGLAVDALARLLLPRDTAQRTGSSARAGDPGTRTCPGSIRATPHTATHPCTGSASSRTN
jgi:hypothetical protein